MTWAGFPLSKRHLGGRDAGSQGGTRPAAEIVRGNSVKFFCVAATWAGASNKMALGAMHQLQEGVLQKLGHI